MRKAALPLLTVWRRGLGTLSNAVGIGFTLLSHWGRGGGAHLAMGGGGVAWVAKRRGRGSCPINRRSQMLLRLSLQATIKSDLINMSILLLMK